MVALLGQLAKITAFSSHSFLMTFASIDPFDDLTKCISRICNFFLFNWFYHKPLAWFRICNFKHRHNPPLLTNTVALKNESKLRRNNTAKNTIYKSDLAGKIKIGNSQTYSFSCNQCVCNLCDFFKMKCIVRI